MQKALIYAQNDRDKIYFNSLEEIPSFEKHFQDKNFELVILINQANGNLIMPNNFTRFFLSNKNLKNTIIIPFHGITNGFKKKIEIYAKYKASYK
mgnify:CR=1 FL=1